jgi:hypothetical protein
MSRDATELIVLATTVSVTCDAIIPSRSWISIAGASEATGGHPVPDDLVGVRCDARPN